MKDFRKIPNPGSSGAARESSTGTSTLIQTPTVASPPPSRAAAYARSMRAYVLMQRDEKDRAFAEFAEAEKVTPENAWLHYFRALCYGQLGDTDQLVAGLGTVRLRV